MASGGVLWQQVGRSMTSDATREARTRDAINLVPVALSDYWYVNLMEAACEDIMRHAGVHRGSANYTQIMQGIGARIRELNERYAAIVNGSDAS